jgi:hypothetical protein
MERFKYFISISTIFLLLKLGVLHSGHTFADNSPKPLESIRVASFNIQFVGHFKKKRNDILAAILKDYDLVFVQELVAPPTDIQFGGDTYITVQQRQGHIEIKSGRFGLKTGA